MKQHPVRSAVLCISILALAACSPEEPANNLQVEVPEAEVEVFEAQVPDSLRFMPEEMSVLLEGTLQPMMNLSQAEGQLSIIVDEESLKTGVARAYRGNQEFEAFLKGRSEGCSDEGVSASDTTSACVFYDNSNCGNWTRRLAINCGYGVGNMSSLLTVRSFTLGCGTTFLCPTANCSGSCSGLKGTAGTCVNLNSGVVQCAGCANF